MLSAIFLTHSGCANDVLEIANWPSPLTAGKYWLCTTHTQLLHILKLKRSLKIYLLRQQSASTQPRGGDKGETGTGLGGNKDRTLHTLTVYEFSSICTITSEWKTNQTFIYCFHNSCASLSQKPEGKKKKKRKQENTHTHQGQKNKTPCDKGQWLINLETFV